MNHPPPSIKLTRKFKRGLEEHGLTIDDMANWKYYGGNRGRHFNYWKISRDEGENLPEHTNKCICDHYIQENCYITDDSEILILGNCCIKKFISKSGRTCGICGEPHQNTSVNRCGTPTSGCRKGRCDSCGRDCQDNYAKCYICYYR